MHNITRLAATITTALLATTALAAPAPSNAGMTIISAGDQVDYVSPNANTRFCTIGYAYSGPDLHTYAITAGHCADSTSGYARDARVRLTGNFVQTLVEPPRSGGADYGLIDFGKNSVPSTVMGDAPTTDDHPQPQVGESICHLGVSSGQHCGQITATQGTDQYLTTGMPASIPGDSGGPVWTRAAHGFVQIIGIWLGQKTTAAGQEYGRFASLARGLQLLSASSYSPGRRD
ncbi:MAG: S1 family peptidase [Mycobacteriaceae bacterium]|nr:S1 family peptidase [Mycobacteriaceae bacterium]